MMLSTKLSAGHRRRQLQRSLSTAAASIPRSKDDLTNSAASPSSPPSSAAARLPTRHSHRKLPLVCTNQTLKTQITRQLLNAPIGSLFTYQVDQDSADQAWSIADDCVQKTEYVLRGHAHSLPGTTWSRWLLQEPSCEISNDQAMETIDVMQRLLDRLSNEGLSYMQLRAARLEETQGPRVNAHEIVLENDAESEDGNNTELIHAKQVFESVQSLQDDVNELSGEQAMEDSDSSSDSESDSDDDNENNATLATNEPTYMQDFSHPGPTTHMYDVLLDAMACQAHVVTARETYLLWEDLMLRHELDGGDASNKLWHTRPTLQSYNASIRVAAELPYDLSDQSPRNMERRDDAIHLTFSVFDVLSESLLHSCNSATYTYLLQVVAKYLPQSRSKGHIARGMLLHAREQGLLDSSMVKAYRSANEPPNGDEFLETLQVFDRPVRELPHKWRANNRKLRNHPREATY
ncbi:hypothetical protein MPSEU_000584300 [Mayamaea pseudoterrestris]|nr:hypothetical protein MPSEU_000584300 [Mayamaea pseudoterrestris]